jgi:hypothetical protein
MAKRLQSGKEYTELEAKRASAVLAHWSAQSWREQQVMKRLMTVTMMCHAHLCDDSVMCGNDVI